MGIDDVPVMSVTLWHDDVERGATEPAEVADSLEAEPKRIPGTCDVYMIGAGAGRAGVVDVLRLAADGLTIEELKPRCGRLTVSLKGGERVVNGEVVPLTVARSSAMPNRSRRSS